MSDSYAVLLHAAARGARLQYRYVIYDTIHDKWCESLRPPVKDSGIKWRIHPDDRHLRYGVVSSALYRQAKNPPVRPMYIKGRYVDETLDHMMDNEDWFRYVVCKSSKTRSLFLLLVAESLIEDGL